MLRGTFATSAPARAGIDPERTNHAPEAAAASILPVGSRRRVATQRRCGRAMQTELLADWPTQQALDLGDAQSAGEVLDRIRDQSRTEVEKGTWFENLFARVARNEPELELDTICRWVDWPEREDLTGLDGRDIGVDLVAKHHDGTWMGSIKIRCARLTGERQGVRVPRNEGVTNHVSPRAVRRSSRGVRRSVGSGSCGRAVEHRKGTCPGCRGFRIGRRQHRWPRYGEWSASPAVSENPCTHESLSSGPGRPPPHLGLSAGVAKGRQNCRSRRRTGRRSQTRS